MKCVVDFISRVDYYHSYDNQCIHHAISFRERDVDDIHPTIIHDQHLHSLTDLIQLICETYYYNITIFHLTHSLYLHSHILSVHIILGIY